MGFLGGHVEVVAHNPSNITIAEEMDMLLAFPQERNVSALNFAATVNMITRRIVIDDVGGFEETLRSHGDLEWGQKNS